MTMDRVLLISALLVAAMALAVNETEHTTDYEFQTTTMATTTVMTYTDPTSSGGASNGSASNDSGGASNECGGASNDSGEASIDYGGTSAESGGACNDTTSDETTVGVTTTTTTTTTPTPTPTPTTPTPSSALDPHHDLSDLCVTLAKEQGYADVSTASLITLGEIPVASLGACARSCAVTAGCVAIAADAGSSPGLCLLLGDHVNTGSVGTLHVYTLSV